MDVSSKLPLASARVFYDGARQPARLCNPEGIAVHPDGSVWCGTGLGDIVRISPDGSSATVEGSTGGFILGIDFDAEGNLFACDMTHCAVFRRDARSGALERFAENLRIPNVPLVDLARGVLYVSDSYAYDRPGPGVWCYDLASGRGGMWCDADFAFANGLALSADGNHLFVAESAGKCVKRLAIDALGKAQAPEIWIASVPGIPDGLGWDNKGRLIVTCYEPSRICREAAPGQLDILIDDPAAMTLCHPANVALRGDTMFASNLGRWHVTSIDLDR